MTATITALNDLNVTILTGSQALDRAESLNADTEDDCSYRAEKKDHGYAVAVYDEDGEFVLYL